MKTAKTLSAMVIVLGLAALAAERPARAENCYSSGAINTIQLRKFITLENLTADEQKSDRAQIEACSAYFKSLPTNFHQVDLVTLGKLECQATCKATVNCLGYIGCLD
ncbi:MAG: hypothetical protein HYW49_12705 [Deltaproteobacteria bacterium]|nr:hypothetical protein [Deltaproteobacteria bacterium]